MARILGVPAVHPSHVGDVEMSTPLVPGLRWPTICVGETRICDADGVTLGRLSYEDGEGWIAADVDIDAEPQPRDPLPAGFWNSLLPISVHARVARRQRARPRQVRGDEAPRMHEWEPGPTCRRVPRRAMALAQSACARHGSEAPLTPPSG